MHSADYKDFFTLVNNPPRTHGTEVSHNFSDRGEDPVICLRLYCQDGKLDFLLSRCLLTTNDTVTLPQGVLMQLRVTQYL